MPQQKQTLPILMREAGYQTCIVGKWHLQGEPNFDHYHVLQGQGSYTDPFFFVKGKGQYGNRQQAIKTKGHSTDVITDASLAWLESRDRSKPFFMCLHYKAPHGLWHNAPRYDDYSDDVVIPEPENLFERGKHGSVATRGINYELLPYIGSSIGERNILRNQLRLVKENSRPVSGKELTRLSHQTYLKQYLRCVKGVDDNIARVLEQLKESGDIDNTVILYTGDQGMWLGEHDYIDKRWMYEESMRMPLIVRFPPGIKAGSTSRALINNTDFAPTILDLVGIETPDSMHGRSFRSVLVTGKAPTDWRTSIYYRYWHQLAHHFVPAHFGVRTDRFKLIFFYGISDDKRAVQTPPGWELYDLDQDPHEMHNVYADPAYADTIAKMKSQLQSLQKEFGEDDSASPRIQAVIDAHWNTTAESRAEAAKISQRARKEFERVGVRKKKNERDK